jgi:hypothetical protein
MGKVLLGLVFVSFDITKWVYILNINIPLINYCRLDKYKKYKSSVLFLKIFMNVTIKVANCKLQLTYYEGQSRREGALCWIVEVQLRRGRKRFWLVAPQKVEKPRLDIGKKWTVISALKIYVRKIPPPPPLSTRISRKMFEKQVPLGTNGTFCPCPTSRQHWWRLWNVLFLQCMHGHYIWTKCIMLYEPRATT